MVLLQWILIDAYCSWRFSFSTVTPSPRLISRATAHRNGSALSPVGGYGSPF